MSLIDQYIEVNGPESIDDDGYTVYERAVKGLYNPKPVGDCPKDPEGRKAWREEINKRSREATARFQADLEKEHGVQNNPKRDLLWQKAWERGHGYGYSEVASIYGDLVELIQ